MKTNKLFKSKWRGLKIGLFGFVLGYSGALAEIHLNHWLGYPIAALGFLFVIIGFIIHTTLYFNELTANPKKTYKKEKQPWEDSSNEK